MADRFYLPTPPTDGQATLDGAEAHHLLHVMRAQVGQQVMLFDGAGGEYPATIDECSRREVHLTVGERQSICRELPVALTLGVALPKGDRQKWLVEKLTELGVATLVPLATERSVAEVKGKSLERLERTVIEACKQCGRNQLMQIAAPEPLAAFVERQAALRLVAHPTGEPVAHAFATAPNDVAAIVGPEGGLSDEEIQLATAYGWTPASLGPSILRIETAALAIAAVVGAVAVGGER